MGVNLIFFGFLFLINPELITLDPLPDFFGYLLMARGLYKLSLLEDRLSLSRKYAFLLAGTSLLKLLSCTITFSTRIESTRLTVCFFFLVAELAFSFLFCDNALKGIQYLAIRKNGDLALKSYDLVRTFMLSFFTLKAGVNFLPVLPVIFYPNIDAEGDKVENYTRMVSSFRTVRSILFIVGALVIICFGIYTANILLAYIKRLKEDTPFASAIKSAYEENVTNNLSLQTRLAIKDAFFWFFLAFLCLADLYLDFINMIPKPLFPLFVFFGLRRIAPFVEIKKWQKSLSLVSFFVLLGTYIYRLYFVINDVKNFPFTFPFSPVAAVVGILGAVFTFLTVVIALMAISAITKKYTTAEYKKIRTILLVLGFAVAGLSFSQYFFVGRSDVVVFAQWAFYAVLLYFHKSSLDDIRAEAEYKLM